MNSPVFQIAKVSRHEGGIPFGDIVLILGEIKDRPGDVAIVHEGQVLYGFPAGMFTPLTLEELRLEDDDVIRPEFDIPAIPEAEQEERKFGLSLSADPLTAGFNAATAFFNFLSTTQGQRVVERMIALDDKFLQAVHVLFQKIQSYIGKRV